MLMGNMRHGRYGWEKEVDLTWNRTRLLHNVLYCNYLGYVHGIVGTVLGNLENSRALIVKIKRLIGLMMPLVNLI